MNIDLDTLTKTRVRKSQAPGFMSILNAVPVQPRTRVRKAANTPKHPLRQPTRKAVHPQPYKPTPETTPSSTIGNQGRPNATSHASGAPTAVDKPSGIDAVLAAVNALTAAVTIATSPKTSTANIDAVLRASRAEDNAEAWNQSRSAAQRQGFTFHAAKGDNSTVKLGTSAHSVRMQGNKFAPAPVTARKAEERKAWFNDSYMARLGRR